MAVGMKQVFESSRIALAKRALELRQPGLDQRRDIVGSIQHSPSPGLESYILCGGRARG